MDAAEREFNRLARSVIPMMYELREYLSAEFSELSREDFGGVMMWVQAALLWECGAPSPLATMILVNQLPAPLQNMVAHIVTGERKPKFKSRKPPQGEMRALLMQSIWINSKFHALEKRHTEDIADALSVSPQAAQSRVHTSNRETLARILRITGADLDTSTIEKMRKKTEKFYADIGVIAPD